MPAPRPLDRRAASPLQSQTTPQRGGERRPDHAPHHHRPLLRYISPHDPRGKGPRVIGPRGQQLGKQMKGQTLPQGAYLLTPGLGKTDRIVQAEMKLVVK